MFVILGVKQKMREECCLSKDCNYNHRVYENKLYCDLAHSFVKDIKKCVKEMTVEQIKNNCSCYIPPKDMGDGKSCCTAHLDSGRAFPCRIKSVEDLLRDPDFEFGKCILRSKSKKNV